MTRLAMIRHAPTDWNEAGRIQGRHDTMLSEDGRAMVAGWQVPAPLDTWRWITSPLSRTRTTAALLDHSDCPVDARLAEMDWGAWVGSTLDDLRSRHGDAMADNEAAGLDFRPDDGESPRELQFRLAAFLRDTAHAGEPTVAVTHRGVMRAALGLATGWDFTSPQPLKLERDAVLMLTLSADGTPELEDPTLLSLVPSS